MTRNKTAYLNIFEKVKVFDIEPTIYATCEDDCIINTPSLK